MQLSILTSILQSRVRYAAQSRALGQVQQQQQQINSVRYNNQRWSRGHKARGQRQDQGYKKIRGQGQGQPFRGQTLSRPRSRTKDTGASVLKKKGLQKYFSSDPQFIGVPRIFDWGRPKPQITRTDVIKIFPKRKFLWDKNIVGWKI